MIEDIILKKIILATNNRHKCEEFSRILEPVGYKVVSLSDVGIDSNPDENADSFEGNALIKARAISSKTDCMVMADDSGLCVDALSGAPGVHSARYAGEGASAKECNEKLLMVMKNFEERSAHFCCVIALIEQGGQEHLFRGECHGKIAQEASGDGGFGYDPIFLVGDRSFAELSKEEKDEISHRGRASELLKEYLIKL